MEMDRIRIATPDEIERVRGESDLPGDGNFTAVAFERSGGQSDIAIVKRVLEVDPVFFSDESSVRRRSLFIWALEGDLRLAGNPEYYFNVPAADTEWIKNVEAWGAVTISRSPELRFKRVL